MKKYLVMLPGPTNVSEDVAMELALPVISHRDIDFHELLWEVEDGLKYVLRTSNPVLIFTASGTGAVEAALANFFRAGDKLLVPVFGEFSKRAAEIAERMEIVVARREIELGRAPTVRLMEDLIEENPDAVGVFVVYNETSTGVTVRELRDICKVAKTHGLLTVVDAISIVGGDNLDVDDYGIDVCIGATQKCLGAPPVLSFMSVSEEAAARARRGTAKTTYFNVELYLQYLEKGETPFTPAIPLFYALRRALRAVREEGIDNRVKRHKVCAEAFYSAIESMKLEVFPEKDFRSNVVIAVKYPRGIDDRDFRTRIKEDFGVLIGGGMGPLRGKIFRIGNMGIVSRTEVLTTIAAIGSTLLNMGYRVNVEEALAAARGVLEVANT